jgi:hypothetical protein
MNAMKEILPTLGSNVDFEIHFIANDNGDGTFTSLHGQPEVDENIRESCVMKYYPKPDDFMKYIWCRNANMKTDWQKCASDSSMDASKIKACSEGSEGKDLLRQKIKLSNDLQIGASPTWMANNKYQFSAIDAETAKSSFCQYNKVSGCEKTLSGNTQGAQASGAACGG